MTDELINISLRQGRNFNKYQNKIKEELFSDDESLIEGFVTSINEESKYDTKILVKEEERNKINNKINKNELNELTKLQKEYNNIVNNITLLENEINERNKMLLNRESVSNTYLNKNITLDNNNGVLPIDDSGYGGYVTSKGVFKPYPNIDVYNNTSGLNGCPTKQQQIKNVSSNTYSDSLKQGTEMVKGQSCGYEGQNIYTTRLVDNVESKYIGCYNDQDSPITINIVPKMTSTNNINGYTAKASSVYQNNNNYGPWCAFDQNKNTFWHCTTNIYDSNTGIYKGSVSLSVNTVKSGLISIKGEYLQIIMPSNQSIKLTSYDIQGRQDFTNGRNPNTWYIVGSKNNQWYEVDYRQNENYDKELKNYRISNPNNYNSYAIIVTVAGNSSAAKGTRGSVQISTWNLYSNSVDSGKQSAMIFNKNEIGYTSFNNCASYALDNGYKYFGVRNLDKSGNAECLVSNDLTQTKSYGDGSKKLTALPLWSSNTSGKGATKVELLGTGELVLSDINNNIIARINNRVANCENSGNISIQSATYGGNCSNNNVSIGNVTNKVTNCNNKNICSIPISNGTLGDPAKGCVKNFDITYKCGSKSFSKNMAPAEGKTLILDCKSYINNTCTFFLLLQNNGNLCIYAGSDPSKIINRSALWCSKTNNKQQQINNDWKASKGKFGRNYMKMGETLALGEWIGSNDGKLKLQMENDGNLVLYTTTIKSGCIMQNKTMFGTDNVNAVYELNNMGNVGKLGKIAYIDEDSKLREYPQNMLGKSNDYVLYQNFDSKDNDIRSVQAKQVTDCVTECNKDTNCNGFSFQKDSKICNLKNNKMFPNSNRQYNTNFTLGLRKPTIISNDTCSKKINEVSTTRYDNYIKGKMMTSSTQCTDSVLTNEYKRKLNNLNNKLTNLGNKIASKMESMYSKDNKIYEKMNMNDAQFKQTIQEYRDIKNKTYSNIIEGMQTIRTMNDINGMLTNSDLIVLQENYSYMLWSILAVGILTITVNTIKK